MKRNSRNHWRSSYKKPSRRGWYECRARDDRWDGKPRYRAWGDGQWWIPLEGGWLSSPMGLYRWRGPSIGFNTEAGEALEKNGGIKV